jgi:hypothetical protein
MLAPPRPASRGPVLRRRALTRSSLVGIGLIALTTSGMPVALADDEEPDLGTSGLEADLDGVEKPAPEVLVLDEVVDDEVVDNDVVAAPAASIEGFFGRGKEVSFQVGYDDTTAPTGLDLSGAVFTLSSGDDEFFCTTDVSGSCSVEAIRHPAYAWAYAYLGFQPQVASDSHALVPPGSYTVTQTGNPLGLAVAADSAQVYLCNEDEYCEDDEFEPVVNDSVFRSPVVSAVRHSVTGAPIEGAVYTLTGPGYYVLGNEDEWYDEDESSGDEGSDEGSGDEGSDEGSEGEDVDILRVEAVPEDDDADGEITDGEITDEEITDEEIIDGDESDPDAPLLQEVRATSAADGSLTFAGWFLPDTEYVLAPVGTVDGYEADTETTGIEITAPAGDQLASLDPRLLDPIVVPATVDPVTPNPTPPPAPNPPPAPAPISAPVGGGARTGGGAPAGGQAGRVVAPAPAVLAEEPSAAQESSPSAPTASASIGGTSAPASSAPAVAGADAPELSTVSSNLPDRGLVMALGGLFLIAIVVAFGLVRRHARRRG